MEDEDKYIVTHFIGSSLLVIVALIIGYIGYGGTFAPEGETNATWFQRSGSLIVVCALWLEFNLFKVNDLVNPTGIITEDGDRFFIRYGRYFSTLKYVGAVVALIGTIIWGYGDLFAASS